VTRKIVSFRYAYSNSQTIQPVTVPKSQTKEPVASRLSLCREDFRGRFPPVFTLLQGFKISEYWWIIEPDRQWFAGFNSLPKWQLARPGCQNGRKFYWILPIDKADNSGRMIAQGEKL